MHKSATLRPFLHTFRRVKVTSSNFQRAGGPKALVESPVFDWLRPAESRVKCQNRVRDFANAQRYLAVIPGSLAVNLLITSAGQFQQRFLAASAREVEGLLKCYCRNSAHSAHVAQYKRQVPRSATPPPQVMPYRVEPDWISINAKRHLNAQIATVAAEPCLHPPAALGNLLVPKRLYRTTGIPSSQSRFRWFDRSGHARRCSRRHQSCRHDCRRQGGWGRIG